MPGHLIRRLQQIAVSIWLDETADCDVRPVQFAAMAAIRAFPGNDQMDLSRIIGFRSKHHFRMSSFGWKSGASSNAGRTRPTSGGASCSSPTPVPR
jgi:hypothetical protein